MVYYKYKAWPVARDTHEQEVAETARSRVTGIIAEQQAHLSCVRDLNDPYEGNLLAIDHMAKVQHPPESDEFSRALFELDAEWLRTLSEYKVFCVSGPADAVSARGWNIPLMWSHYADSHRGVCIGLHFDGGVEPTRMHYMPSIKNITNFVGDPACPKKALTSKFHYWRYEQEYRVIQRSCESHIPITVTEIIVGFRMPQEERRFWWDFGREHGIPVARATLSGGATMSKTKSKNLILCDGWI